MMARMGMYLEISRFALVQLVIGVDPVIFRVKYETRDERINPVGTTRIKLNNIELSVCEN